MIVHIPTHLEAYTDGVNEVKLTIVKEDATLADALLSLDNMHQGIRFRFMTEQDEIREHFQLFVDKKRVHDLKMPMKGCSEIHIIAALSGG